MSIHLWDNFCLNDDTKRFLLLSLVEDEARLSGSDELLSQCSDAVDLLHDRISKQREALEVLGITENQVEEVRATERLQA